MIGASGFLGSRLLALAPSDIELTGTGCRRPVPPGRWRGVELDTAAVSQVQALIERDSPHVVIHCSYQTGNRIVTVDGPRTTARAAARAGARYVFVSTDLVFDGREGGYDELAPVAPVMTYGEHKRDAELFVRDAHETAVILRPSLMVGESFAHRRPAYECELLDAGHACALFADEWRSPVHVDDVARAIWHLADLEVGGVFHLGGPDRLSRLELGDVLCDMYGLDRALLRAAVRPADRPRDTSLDSARLTALLGWAAAPLHRWSGAHRDG